MSTQKYIGIFCKPGYLGDLFTDNAFIICIGDKYDNVINGSSSAYMKSIPAYSKVDYVTHQGDIDIDTIRKLFTASIYFSGNAFCIYGKYNDIKSKLENLANKPKYVMINSGNLSCENLKEAIKSNLHAEIKYKLTQIFEHKNIVDKLFELISQDDINKHVLELLICIVNSKPLEANVKNAASKLLIDWTPSFAKYMMESFNAKDNF